MENPSFNREESAHEAQGMIGRGPRRPGLLGTLAWTAGIAGGLLALAAISTLPSRRRRDPAGRPHPADVRQQLADWQKKAIGRSKRQIAQALGAPPAAAPEAQAATPAASFWDANTWYYPYNRDERCAVAIEFRANRVARVELITSPA